MIATIDADGALRLCGVELTTQTEAARARMNFIMRYEPRRHEELSASENFRNAIHNLYAIQPPAKQKEIDRKLFWLRMNSHIKGD